MRRDFKDYLFELMQDNPDIWVVTADLGYGMFDKIRDTFPNRFINTGAAEVAAMDICVGLTLEGKIPLFYSITPFALYRPFEVIRTYIDHEKIPVIIIGGGRGDDYKHDGWSHNASDDKLFMKHFENIYLAWPNTTKHMRKLLKIAIEHRIPTYINLIR